MLAQGGHGYVSDRLRYEQMNANRAQNAETIKALDELVTGEEELKLYQTMKDNRQNFITKRNEVIEVLRQSRFEESTHLYNTMLLPAVAEYKASLTAFTNYQEVRIDEQSAEMLAANQRTGYLMLSGLAIAALFAVFGAWYVTRAIVKPLRDSVQVAEAVAKGESESVGPAKAKGRRRVT